MPFIYQKPISEKVTYVHKITWLDTVLWGIWQVLRFIVKSIGWICKHVWYGMVFIYSWISFRLRFSSRDFHGDL
jgi:hypothetical protein